MVCTILQCVIVNLCIRFLANLLITIMTVTSNLDYGQQPGKHETGKL